MPDKKKLIREFILNNPNLSGAKVYTKIKGTPLGIRKTDFYKIFREIKKLPEPTKEKKKRSIPTKYKVAKPKVAKSKVAKPKPSITKILKQKEVIPFAETKFGKITIALQKEHGISEKKAIIHARKILKIDKSDYDKINEKDVQILLAITP